MRTLCVVVTNLKGTPEVILTPSNASDQTTNQWDAKAAQIQKDGLNLLTFY